MVLRHWVRGFRAIRVELQWLMMENHMENNMETANRAYVGISGSK